MTTRQTLRITRLLWLSVFLSAHSASAHDFLFGSAVARVRSDSIELTVTLLGDAFLKIFRNSAATSEFVFTKEQFPRLRPIFSSFAAKHLYEVTIDDRQQQPMSADVELVDDEFVFRLSYPRPDTGELQLSASYIQSVLAQFRAHVTVVTDLDVVIASKVLVEDDFIVRAALPPR